ncbi:hypothetical protein [Stenotrophomonas maltophilia]|uniref:hypothetical protein n=1 Tax=Stenotrophomonas maltophilia TaxID=40324 RepID=UPI0021C8D358|nr:hypothetical protein [Stenotrophomonas maltophilia]MCU1103023.1 hypothetical protein [Stenotrophomonas maltophilia]
MDAPLLTRLDPRKVRVRVAMMPPPLTRFLFARWGKNCQRLQPLVHAMPHWRRPAHEITESSFAHNVYYVQSIPGDAGVPFASIPSRPGSYGFLHRPIRVLCMPQAIQPQTKPTPRDNDLFLFKGGSIQSLIGHESQRSQ